MFKIKTPFPFIYPLPSSTGSPTFGCRKTFDDANSFIRLSHQVAVREAARESSVYDHYVYGKQLPHGHRSCTLCYHVIVTTTAAPPLICFLRPCGIPPHPDHYFARARKERGKERKGRRKSKMLLSVASNLLHVKINTD